MIVLRIFGSKEPDYIAVVAESKPK